MLRLPQWTTQLRKWQEKAYQQYFELDKHDFLLVATPGAGKTTFSLCVAHQLLQAGTVDRVVIVCPTTHLKRQWHTEAVKVGIHLDPTWGNDRCVSEASDYHGVCVTYQQVASSPEIHRAPCRHSTLVIFDEIHHAGDQLRWGDSIQKAFEYATRRLSISGTPFRTDNSPIPFVTYDDNSMSIADFSYGYGDALSDNICRQLIFPSYEGRMEWLYKDEYRSGSFCDSLTEDQANQRLMTALHPKGDWICEVFTAANKELVRIRSKTHPDAGGLIIARDQDHARRLADAMAKISGTIPDIAVSDLPDASAIITGFKNSTTPWLVAVKMVSEGVDIPRLRVGVYATNVTTELYFRQAVGRFVRWIKGIEDQCSIVFIPRDERFVEFVQKIKAEIMHHLIDDPDNSAERYDQEPDKAQQLGLYVPITSTGEASDVFYDSQTYDQREIAKATALLETIGASMPPAQFLWLQAMWDASVIIDRPSPSTQTKTRAEEKEGLRTQINKMVAKLVYSSDEAITYPMVHGWCRKQDGKELRDCTIDELERRKKWLLEWLRNPLAR